MILLFMIIISNEYRWRAAGSADCFIVEKSPRRTAFGIDDFYYLPYFFPKKEIEGVYLNLG